MQDYRMDTFLAVCEEGSYTKAAEKLHITQPAVTQHIHFLEDYYGTKLIQIKDRKVCLTPKAEQLKIMLMTLRNDESVLKEEMSRKEGEKHLLKLGVTLTIGEFVIAEPLSRYIKNHEEIQTRVVIANTEELLQKLRNGEIQIALIEGYFRRKEFESKVFRTERIIPVVASGFIFRKKPKKLEDLFGERLIVREKGSGTREVLEKGLAVRGFAVENFTEQTEINSIYAIIQFVKEGTGISFLYESAVRREIEEGTLREIRLSDFSLHHDFTFIWNKGSVYGNEYSEVCRELEKML
jgi:DNA-binding transcriptional LysR family regulator